MISSSSTAEYALAVVGGGVAAKAMALGAAQAGLKVALVGAKPIPREDLQQGWDQRVYAISPGSQALLDQLSVWQAIPSERIGPVHQMKIAGDRGAHLDLTAYQAHVERLASIMEQRAIEAALDAALPFMKNLSRFESKATGLSTDSGHATLILGNDHGTLLSAITAQLVVGADGARSWLRDAANISSTSKPYGVTAVVAHLQTSQPHQQIAHQWFTSHGVLALLPLADPVRVSMVWSAPEALARELLELSSAELAQRVSLLSQHTLGELSDAQAIGGYPLQLLKVEQLTSQRVALVGDAAHVVHPLAGQGLNLGLQDVRDLLAVLAEKENWRDCGDARVLARYTRRRAEPIKLMQLTTDGLHHLFTNPHPLAGWLRNTGMSLLDPLGPLKRMLIAHAMG